MARFLKFGAIKNIFKNISIRFLVCGSLMVTSLIAVFLLLYMGLEAYNRSNLSSRLYAMNDLADKIIIAASQEALERGVGATALANPAKVSMEVVNKIKAFRKKGDTALKEALSIAEEAVEEVPGTRFSMLLDKMKNTYKSIEEARKWVDMSLKEGTQYIGPRDWFNTMTELIDMGAQLRQAAFISSDNPFQQITQDNLILKQAVWLVSEYMGRERGTIGPIIASGKPISPSVLEKLKAYRALVEQGIKDMISIGTDKETAPRIVSAIEEMERSLKDFDGIREKVYSVAETGNYPISAGSWIGMATDAIEKVLDVSRTVTEVNRERASEISRISNRNVYLTVALISGVLVFVFLVFFVVGEKIKRIKALRESMDQLAGGEGDLTFRLDASSEDEIGETAEAFNIFMDQLRNIIIQVDNATAQVASAAMELSTMAEEMSKSSEDQTQQTLQAASALEEMSSSVNEVAKNASDVANFSDQAKKVAEEGGEIVKTAVGSMEIIAKSVMDTASVIKDLGTSSTQIGEIVSVIDNIAEQTNLLALNAAIEAARASEQGKGFAVVADEVRKLAERTTRATSKIATMIKGIQGNIEKAIEVMNLGTSEVDNGVNFARKAGEALQQIVDASRRVTDMVMQIAAAAEEQGTVSMEISGSVEKISHLCKDNNSAVGETTRASEELSRLAMDLRQLVSRFKIEQA